MSRLRIILSLIAAISAATAALPSRAADNYPNRPIRLVVPTGAGGNTDTFARVVAEKLKGHLGQQIIVDNRTGASGQTRAVNRGPLAGCERPRVG